MDPASQTLCRIARVLSGELGANVTESDLQGLARLDQVVALDSIALLELALGLEREFAIRFEPDCMKRDFLVDIPGLVQYFDRKLAGAPR